MKIEAGQSKNKRMLFSKSGLRFVLTNIVKKEDDRKRIFKLLIDIKKLPQPGVQFVFVNLCEKLCVFFVVKEILPQRAPRNRTTKPTQREIKNSKVFQS